jgi:hypothetical protein
MATPDRFSYADIRWVRARVAGHRHHVEDLHEDLPGLRVGLVWGRLLGLQGVRVLEPRAVKGVPILFLLLRHATLHHLDGAWSC